MSKFFFNIHTNAQSKTLGDFNTLSSREATCLHDGRLTLKTS